MKTCKNHKEENTEYPEGLIGEGEYLPHVRYSPYAVPVKIRFKI